MRRFGVSRRDLFFELDRPALKPLPGEPMKPPSGGCAGLDYHFDIDGHYYSVPSASLRAARRPDCVGSRRLHLVGSAQIEWMHEGDRLAGRSHGHVLDPSMNCLVPG